ncbi:hypothetical protein NDU88_003792 [Pleurodeles waltl]|uniref:Uncharacterized protein n=1 Tax=Pleurodeles waltl TaxID=8319 RepID=A0AAV7NKU6_PLEWA|nr:hypothetical protein NDU88_003792 [Pleurodeles waltl]
MKASGCSSRRQALSEQDPQRSALRGAKSIPEVCHTNMKPRKVQCRVTEYRCIAEMLPDGGPRPGSPVPFNNRRKAFVVDEKDVWNALDSSLLKG